MVTSMEDFAKRGQPNIIDRIGYIAKYSKYSIVY
jgi:hypothetical protein